MWRQRASLWAALAVVILVGAACVGWALLAQQLVTPACEQQSIPTRAGPLKC